MLNDHLVEKLYIMVVFVVFLFSDFSRLNRMHGRVLEAGVFSLKFIDMYNEIVWISTGSYRYYRIKEFAALHFEIFSYTLFIFYCLYFGGKMRTLFQSMRVTFHLCYFYKIYKTSTDLSKGEGMFRMYEHRLLKSFPIFQRPWVGRTI